MNPKNDASTTVEELKSAMAQFATERDWAQFHSPKNLSMAIATEAGELIEHFLWDDSAQAAELLTKPGKKAKIADELADVLLFSVQFANMTGIDISAAIFAKLEKNAAKYPVAKAKGRSDKYTAL